MKSFFFEKDEVMLKNGLMWELVADLKTSSTKKQAVTFIKKFVASANAIVASKNADKLENAKSKGYKKAVKTMEEDFYNQSNGSTWTIGWGSKIKNSIAIKFNKKKISALNYDKLKI
jgi:GH24 family phage-related lysozyme (muramidase)